MSPFCRAFAISRDEVIGQPLITIGDRRLDIAEFRDFLDLIRANVLEDYEVEVEIFELGSRVLLLSAQQIANEPMAQRETLMVIDDVTERRHAEMALIAAKWHSDRANLGKSRILAAASHDLRQPLQTLNLMRAALAKKIKDKEGLELIAQLNKTSEVMLSMLDTLLEINQLEAGISYWISENIVVVLALIGITGCQPVILDLSRRAGEGRHTGRSTRILEANHDQRSAIGPINDRRELVDYYCIAASSRDDRNNQDIHASCIEWCFDRTDGDSYRVLGFLLDLSEVVFAAKTFGLDFVDILRAGQPGGEPSIFRNDLDPPSATPLPGAQPSFALIFSPASSLTLI